MPKGKKAGGRDFQVGHPKYGGRQKMLPEVDKVPRLSAENVGRLVSQIWYMTEEQLDKEILSNPKATIGQKAVGTIAAKSIEDADPNRWEALLRRAIGAVKQDVGLSNADGTPLQLNTPEVKIFAINILQEIACESPSTPKLLEKS